MKNNKGFTLAELLGVIVILVLLFLLATPIFVNYIKGAKDTVSKKQTDSIEKAAKRWASDKDNIMLLPSHEGECVEVTLEKLKDSGYLDYNLKNPETGQKYSDDLTVVIKRENSSYIYTFDKEKNITCGTLIESVYPKWELVSSSPANGNINTVINVVFKSDKKIYSNNLTENDILVRVGSTIVVDANKNLNCANDEYLECTLEVTNLKGNGKLNFVISANTIVDSELNKSKKTTLTTDTKIDGDGPKISFLSKTISTGSNYASKQSEITIKFKAEDSSIAEANLQADDITVYIDGLPVTATKTLSSIPSTSLVEYELKITGIEQSGILSIKIPSGKIIDNVGNVNREKTIFLNIKLDNANPIVKLSPNERLVYSKDMSVAILVDDSETGIDENTLEYVFSKNPNEVPNNSFVNGDVVTLENTEGEYYLIVKACDLVENCITYTSGKYYVSNKGPEIEITPFSSTKYEKEMDITVKVTKSGSNLDDSTFTYVISQDATDEPSLAFENNEPINLSGITGEYYLIVKACDESGNCTTKTGGRYYMDAVAPTIEIELVKKVCSYSLTDNVGLAGLKVTTSSLTPTEWDTITGASYDGSFEAPEANMYYLHVMDSVGNTAYYAFNVPQSAFSYLATLSSTYNATVNCTNSRSVNGANCVRYESHTCDDCGRCCRVTWEPFNVCGEVYHCPSTSTTTIVENQYRYYTCPNNDVLDGNQCHSYTCPNGGTLNPDDLMCVYD